MRRSSSQSMFGTFGLAPLALAGLGACTQPTFDFPPDGSVPGGPGDDASVVTRSDATLPPETDGDVLEASVPGSEDAGADAAVQVTLPAGAERLLGRYLRRSTFFSIAPNDFMARAVEHALLEFTRAADGSITLHTQLCNFNVYNLYLSAQLDLVGPEALGAMDQPVAFNPDGSFRVEARSIITGYDPERLAMTTCAGAGQRVPRFDDQRWVVPASFPEARSFNEEELCTCPGITAEPPSTPTDCRVTDADQDGYAGITAVSPTLPIHWPITLEVLIGYEDGQIGTEGPVQAREVRGLRVTCVNDELGCGFDGQLCVNATSEVMFVPVDDGVDCAYVRDHEAELVPQPVLSFPTPAVCRG